MVQINDAIQSDENLSVTNTHLFTHLSIWHNDFTNQGHISIQLSHFVPATKFSLIYLLSL